MYDSPCKNWQIAFEKYSPSTNIKYAPVVSTVGKILPVYYEDNFLVTMLWGLTTTEEYYYQNCIELLSSHRNDPIKTNNLLTTHRLPAYWPERLTNFYFLGSGAFGTVYKTEDAVNNIEYALKQVSSRGQRNLKKFLDNIITIISEKNSYLRANESSFIVKLYGAFQDESLRSYWLLFEYCVGDLQSYVDEISANMFIFMDAFIERNVIEEMYRVYKDKMDLDVESIAGIYSFELLAGLAYMAKRNLVHNDLKPENVLVSTRGHLKIADLGLAQRVKWLDRYSMVEVVSPDLLLILKSIDERPGFAGNMKYTDPEALISNNMLLPENEIYNRFFHEDFPITNGPQDFLTDLYGVACIMMELLFVGLNFLTTSDISLFVAERFHIQMDVSDEIDILSIRCLYDGDVHYNYLMTILANQITDTNQSIISFLMSCFQPKSRRASNYTKDIEHIKFNQLVRSRCLDLTKIEELDYYKSRNITEYNVCSQEMPTEIFDIYHKELSQPEAKYFHELQPSDDDEDDGGGIEMKMPAFHFIK